MITVAMRLKEGAEDYRYLLDPDLPPMLIEEDMIDRIKEEMPEAPNIKVKRFMAEYGLAEEHAKVLASELALADAFEEVAKVIDSEFAALWMRDEVKRVLSYNKLDYAESKFTSQNLIELFEMIQNKEVTAKAAKKIIETMPISDKNPKAIAEELGLTGIVDESEVIAAVEKAIAENPDAIKDYNEGKSNALNYLVGQVMRFTRGKAEPARTVELLKERL
jgi:aspartyl-tRNA(Asn)/glutamyl-tRNA(Gln) amidotransferase subunit B